MQYDRYVNRTYQKFDRMIGAYAGHIFKKLTKLDELSAYPTMDHLRLPPAPSLLQPITAGAVWGERWGNLWLHADVAVPEECVADKHESPHFANLYDMAVKYADVVPVADVIAYLKSYPGTNA